ncbi:MAG: UDP-3-O-(3-hydroxymyristoyl)glucosamine N-acyltransferase, partial [Prevotella pallens]
KNVYIGAFAYIGDGVVIGDNSMIYPHATIMDNVTLGNNCIIYPNVSIYHNCKIGDNVICHSGSVIGADGFGFAPNSETNSYDKIPQIGIVTIEDNVEIGANTCIDRSTMGSTYLRKGVKLDNLVQIAHNTDIGANTVMSAQVGIAGSTKVGEWCMFGGQVGIAGHLKIGNKVFLGAQSGVLSKLKDNQSLMGSPAIEPRNYFKSQVIFQRLPEIYKQINVLQKEIEELKKNK